MGFEPLDLRLSKQAALTTSPGPPPIQSKGQDKKITQTLPDLQ